MLLLILLFDDRKFTVNQQSGTMNLIELLPLNVFTLQTGELLLTLTAALLTGYAIKLLLDKFVFKQKADPAEELEQEIETLREKYNAQMFKKEEDLKMLQDEVKAAEKRNLDLKIEYAKAINHIEKLKTDPNREGSNGEIPSSTNNIHNEVLLSVKEKIVKQEGLIEELQHQLEEAQLKKREVEFLYEQGLTELADYKTRVEQEKKDIIDSVAKLSGEVSVKEELIKQQETTIQSAEETIVQLWQQLTLAENSNRDEVDTEMEKLKNEIRQLETKLSLADAGDINKTGIATIRNEAEQVTVMIEHFKQHLSATLEQTYSYEQILNKNEKINGVVDQLLAEKQQVENELLSVKQQLHENNAELNKKIEHHEHELKEVQQLFADTRSEAGNQTELLKQQIALKEKELYDAIQEKNNLVLAQESLQQRLDEKEKFSKQMMDVVKEFEGRMLQIYPNADLQHASTVILEDGEIQYH